MREYPKAASKDRFYTPFSPQIYQPPKKRTFADDTSILTRHENAMAPSKMLQKSLKVQKYFKTWKIKVSEEISKHITFTLRK